MTIDMHNPSPDVIETVARAIHDAHADWLRARKEEGA